MSFSLTDIPPFRNALLNWYEGHSRELPWRSTSDPYHIWISEIMLQQTRVDQARPYFERFINAFPSTLSLAEASLDEVLLNWEGLGYYSRARNLHKASRIVVDDFQGELPASHEALLSLPGVGPYTAAAIMSIAFNKPYGVLDGNVIRVLSRLTCNEGNTSSAKTKRILQDLSNTLVAPEHPGNFNQAMMELGATRCTPQKPDCPNCPVHSFCCAYISDSVDLFPVVKKKSPIPHRFFVAGIIENDKREILIQKRPEDAMLGGLWEFPTQEIAKGDAIQPSCENHFLTEFGCSIHIRSFLPAINHAYSHFKITVHACIGRVTSLQKKERKDVRWISPAKLDEYAFHRAHRKLVEVFLNEKDSPSLFDDIKN